MARLTGSIHRVAVGMYWRSLSCGCRKSVDALMTKPRPAHPSNFCSHDLRSLYGLFAPQDLA